MWHCLFSPTPPKDNFYLSWNVFWVQDPPPYLQDVRKFALFLKSSLTQFVKRLYNTSTVAVESHKSFTSLLPVPIIFASNSNDSIDSNQSSESSMTLMSSMTSISWITSVLLILTNFHDFNDKYSLSCQSSVT